MQFKLNEPYIRTLSFLNILKLLMLKSNEVKQLASVYDEHSLCCQILLIIMLQDMCIIVMKYQISEQTM